MITLGGVLSPRSGYSTTILNIERALTAFGYEVCVLPLSVDESEEVVQGRVRRKLVDTVMGTGILVSPPDLVDERFDVQLTMWESSKLPAHMVNRLNQKRLILTPSQWCKTNFVKSGVSTEIKVVPLCINQLQFPRRPISNWAWFGCTHDRCSDRYHTQLLVNAFTEEFTSGEEVKLRLRGMPRSQSKLVESAGHYLQPVELAAWYQSLTVLISPSSGEGWSLVNHEAMCSGRAVASLGVTGESEYMSDECMYRLDYELKPASGIYHGQGMWPVPTSRSIRRVLRRVYENRQEAERKGSVAADVARRFSEENCVLSLVNSI